MLLGINITWKTIALAVTLDPNTPIRNGVAERNVILKIYGVPADLEECFPIVHLVGTSDIGRPVSDRLFLGTPHTTILDANARTVDIVTSNLISILSSNSHARV